MNPLPNGAARRAAVTFLGVLIGATATTPATGQGYDEAFAKYRDYLDRPSLYKRTLGREVLAGTKDPRALDVLVKSYDRPEDPEDANRHLIASIAMRAFGRSADESVLAAWRGRHDDADDAWMWFETLRYAADRNLGTLRELVLGRGDPFLKAAAMEAIAERARKVGVGAEGAGLCLELLDALPKKDLDRALMLETVASVVLANRKRVRHEPWQLVTEVLIRNLDDEATPQRSKVVIARHLAKTFDCPNLGLEAHWWLNELTRAPQPKAQAGRTTTVPFFTVRTTGYRFAYVIDASDSMLKRVTDREKRDLGPTTGGAAAKPKEGGQGFVPTEADIDWNRVVTRFDAAREYLRLSLSSLSDEHEFIVLLFGDEAQPLDATPKLVPANKRTIRAAIAELDKIVAGPPTDRRPDGQLGGQTNLHAGIAAAFGATRSGTTRSQEYVDAKGFVDGCDTVFVLSDGAPSWDDYAEKDTRDPEDQAGDPETGRKFENVPTLIFQGPYARPPFDFLVDDVQRMNLFRKAEIHCVGIGEANHHLLRQIADIGLGQALKVEGAKGR